MIWIALGVAALLVLVVGSQWVYSKLYPFARNWAEDDGVQAFIDYAINSKPFQHFLQSSMEEFEISGDHVKACWTVKKLGGAQGPVHLEIWLQRSDGKRRTRKWVIYLRDEKHFDQVRQAINKLREKAVRKRSWFPWKMLKPPGSRV